MSSADMSIDDARTKQLLGVAHLKFHAVDARVSRNVDKFVRQVDAAVVVHAGLGDQRTPDGRRRRAAFQCEVPFERSLLKSVRQRRRGTATPSTPPRSR